jgi:hypothetical protein
MSEIQKINLINIIKNSLKFLIFEWKFFAIVLGFYIFRYFIYGSHSYSMGSKGQESPRLQSWG